MSEGLRKYAIWKRRHRPEEAVDFPEYPVYQKYDCFGIVKATSLIGVLETTEVSVGDFIEAESGKFYRNDNGSLEVYDSLPTNELVIWEE